MMIISSGGKMDRYMYSSRILYLINACQYEQSTTTTTTIRRFGFLFLFSLQENFLRSQ